MQNLIFDRNVEIKGTSTDRLKILLIDEVDVFFSSEFYGKLYNPVIGIADFTIEKLICYIWENKETLSWEELNKRVNRRLLTA